MEYVHIKEAKIPALGLGTWELRGKEAHRIIEEALSIGYRHIDTAQMYSNESVVGQTIAASGINRDQLFITTKVWWENLDEQNFQRSVENSLSNLRTDYVDLLLIHWPHPKLPLSSYIEQLIKAQEKGAAAHIGISNFTPALIEQAIAVGADLVNNQVEYHPYLDQSDTLEACRRHGLSLTSYSPLARGRVTTDDTIKAIATQHGKTPAQVTLRWHIQQKDVIAIPKTSTPARLKENLDLFDFQLTREEMQRITALTTEQDRMVDPEFAPDWQ